MLAVVALPVLGAVLAVLASGACGEVRSGRYQYLSERLLTCSSHASAWARAVPWLAVVAFAAQLPSWCCTFAQLAALAGDARPAPAAVFGALALAALGGITAVVFFGVKDDGLWRPEHIAGAVVYMTATFMLHALTLLAYVRLHQHNEFYTDSAAVYAVLSLVFLALFVADHPAAAPLQWLILVPMAFIFATNLAIGFRLTRRAPDAGCVAVA